MAKSIHDPAFWGRVVKAMNGIGVRDNYQTEIARLIKISQPTVWEWEKGETMPSMRTALKFALKTNVCVEWLLTNRGPQFPGPPDEPLAKKLWSAWGSLTDDEKGDVAGYATVKAGQNQTPKPPKSRVA